MSISRVVQTSILTENRVNISIKVQTYVHTRSAYVTVISNCIYNANNLILIIVRYRKCKNADDKKEIQ